MDTGPISQHIGQLNFSTAQRIKILHIYITLCVQPQLFSDYQNIIDILKSDLIFEFNLNVLPYQKVPSPAWNKSNIGTERAVHLKAKLSLHCCRRFI